MNPATSIVSDSAAELGVTPFLLTIAGHDPGGGAGLGADLAAWNAMGWRGASACTALTVQGARGVQEVHPTDPGVLAASLRAVLADGRPAGIKLGMLGASGAVGVARDVCAGFTSGPVVWDPVRAGGAGGVALLNADDGALDALARVCDVITPNRDEAAALLGLTPWTDAGPLPAAWLAAMRERWLVGGRTCAVVLKGGHAQGRLSVDWLITRDTTRAFAVPRLPDRGGRRAHGTGCLFASALTAMLAEGWSVADAVAEAQWRTHAGIAQAAWQQRPLANAAARLDSSSMPVAGAPGACPEAPAPDFPPLLEPCGLYPIAPDADWVMRLLDWGARTVQLRIKHLEGAAMRGDIDRAAAAARAAGAQLFINDHWREAIDAGAFGVHLGQEDLDAGGVPALAALRAAGLRLGLSTHTPAEMARAHAESPSYIACGPVYPTTQKQLAYGALGLRRLRDWAARCRPRYPLVAIGGITLDRLGPVLDCGVDGAAVIGAIVQADDPRAALRVGMERARQVLACRAATVG